MKHQLRHVMSSSSGSPSRRGRRLLTLLLLGLALAATGCGAVRSASAIQLARQRYEASRTAGLLNSAPYEFTLGEEYLRKALEASGNSDYSTAVRLAEQARAYLVQGQRRLESPEEDLDSASSLQE